jgi:Fe-S oxidoreductase
MIAAMKAAGLGYSYPIVETPKTKQVWALRKASLGLLANIPGDEKAVACIEDTAVDIQDLPAYIADFTKIMEGFGQRSVYYAHAGAGEIHLRPILDLKKSKDQQMFYDISKASAELVKKYDGSLSGEHGDGRVRAAFIPIMIGEKNYETIKEVKKIWDPKGIFNPGKIVDAAPMNTSLRYKPDQATPEFDTKFDFSTTEGILRAAEKCNGSGDCRKLNFSGGTMCPSYRATRNEKDTTRGRANVLRTFLTMNTKDNPFDHPEIKEAMDLCLSCKGCTSECPSNVDMSTLKAEFLYQYYKTNGVPLRSKAIANIGKLNGLGALVPGLTNFMLSNSLTSGMMKRFLGVAKDRSLPTLHKQTLRAWFRKTGKALPVQGILKRKVYFFCDEFTNFNDTDIGITAIKLLKALGYEVAMPKHAESGRAHMSKGLLDEAQQMAQENVTVFKDIVSEKTPLLGVEPSAILGFRDEYPKLVKEEDQASAKALGQNALMLEEFLFREIEKGNITADQFAERPQTILLHGHCHQKALSRVEQSAWVLGLPKGHQVEIIPSGCCGMAGSFGYEAEHYELSMQVGEQVLFPAVRKAEKTTVIAAAGTSCRHQIKDGTKKQAMHPIEIMYKSLKV